MSSGIGRFARKPPASKQPTTAAPANVSNASGAMDDTLDETNGFGTYDEFSSFDMGGEMGDSFGFGGFGGGMENNGAAKSSKGGGGLALFAQKKASSSATTKAMADGVTEVAMSSSMSANSAPSDAVSNDTAVPPFATKTLATSTMGTGQHKQNKLAPNLCGEGLTTMNHTEISTNLGGHSNVNGGFAFPNKSTATATTTTSKANAKPAFMGGGGAPAGTQNQLQGPTAEALDASEAVAMGGVPFAPVLPTALPKGPNLIAGAGTGNDTEQEGSVPMPPPPPPAAIPGKKAPTCVSLEGVGGRGTGHVAKSINLVSGFSSNSNMSNPYTTTPKNQGVVVPGTPINGTGAGTNTTDNQLDVNAFKTPGASVPTTVGAFELGGEETQQPTEDASPNGGNGTQDTLTGTPTTTPFRGTLSQFDTSIEASPAPSVYGQDSFNDHSPDGSTESFDEIFQRIMGHHIHFSDDAQLYEDRLLDLTERVVMEHGEMLAFEDGQLDLISSIDETMAQLGQMVAQVTTDDDAPTLMMES